MGLSSFETWSQSHSQSRNGKHMFTARAAALSLLRVVCAATDVVCATRTARLLLCGGAAHSSRNATQAT